MPLLVAVHLTQYQMEAGFSLNSSTLMVLDFNLDVLRVPALIPLVINLSFMDTYMKYR